MANSLATINCKLTWLAKLLNDAATTTMNRMKLNDGPLAWLRKRRRSGFPRSSISSATRAWRVIIIFQFNQLACEKYRRRIFAPGLRPRGFTTSASPASPRHPSPLQRCDNVDKRREREKRQSGGGRKMKLGFGPYLREGEIPP